MKIITVSGAHSGVGKTVIVEKLLKRFKNWSCLKVTVVKNGLCPREVSCGVCEEQTTPYTIIEDMRTINQRGKDTQRMKRAGAKKVIWLRAREKALREALREALRKFKGSRGVIIEGTSVLKYLKPDLRIFAWD